MRVLIYRILSILVSLSLFYSASAEGLACLHSELEPALCLALAPMYDKAPMRLSNKPPEVPKDPYAAERQELLTALRVQQSIQKGELLACTSPELWALSLGKSFLQGTRAYGAGIKPWHGQERIPGPGSLKEVHNKATGGTTTFLPLELGCIPESYLVHNSQENSLWQPWIKWNFGWARSIPIRIPNQGLVYVSGTGGEYPVIERDGLFYLPPGLPGAFREQGQNLIYTDRHGNQEYFERETDDAWIHTRTVYDSPSNGLVEVLFGGGSDYPVEVTLKVAGNTVQQVRISYSSSDNRARIHEVGSNRVWELVYLEGSTKRELAKLIKPADQNGTRYEVGFDYDAYGNIREITDTKGELWTREYTSDRLELASDPLKSPTRYAYEEGLEPDTLLARRTWPLSQSAEWTTELLTGITFKHKDEANFESRIMKVGAHLQPESWRDKNGQLWAAGHDGLGNRVQLDRPGGPSLYWNYDNKSRLRFSWDLSGDMWTYNYHASLGYLEQVIDPMGFNVYEASKPTAQGWPQIVSDALNRRTQITYNQTGSLTGLASTVTGPDGVTSTLGYDARYGVVNSVSMPGLPTRSSDFDNLGRLITITNCGLAPGEEHIVYSDDEGGGLKLIDLAGRETLIQHLIQERVVRITYPDSTTYEVSLDANDRPYRGILPGGESWEVLAFTPRGEIRQFRDVDGTQQTFTPTGECQLARLTTARGSVDYLYYPAGEIRSIDYPGTEPDVSFAYDYPKCRFTVSHGPDNYVQQLYPNGLVSQLTSPNSENSYEYDETGALKKLIVNDGSFVTTHNWNYHKTTGRLESAQYWEGSNLVHSTSYGYDKITGIMNAVYHNLSAGPGGSFTEKFSHNGYQQDEVGMYLEGKEPLWEERIEEFTEHGLPKVIAEGFKDGRSWQTASTTYDYHPDNDSFRQEDFTSSYGLNYRNDYRYNDNGELTGWDTKENGVLTQHFFQVKNGQILQADKYVDGKPVQVTTYAYDAHGNMRQEQAGAVITTYTYNYDGFLTGATRTGTDPFSANYKVSPFGQQLSENLRGESKKVYTGTSPGSMLQNGMKVTNCIGNGRDRERQIDAILGFNFKGDLSKEFGPGGTVRSQQFDALGNRRTPLDNNRVSDKGPWGMTETARRVNAWLDTQGKVHKTEIGRPINGGPFAGGYYVTREEMIGLAGKAYGSYNENGTMYYLDSGPTPKSELPFSTKRWSQGEYDRDPGRAAYHDKVRTLGGVKPDDPLYVYAERDAEMFNAFAAILSGGAAIRTLYIAGRAAIWRGYYGWQYNKAFDAASKARAIFNAEKKLVDNLFQMERRIGYVNEPLAAARLSHLRTLQEKALELLRKATALRKKRDVYPPWWWRIYYGGTSW